MTELPLTPPADDEDEEAAIPSSRILSSLSSLCTLTESPALWTKQRGFVHYDVDGGVRMPARPLFVRPPLCRRWGGVSRLSRVRTEGVAGAGRRASF